MTGSGVSASGHDGHQPRRRDPSQGSILTMSSYSTRTSPVLRGKWILENLLNAPPPPPPPVVPALDDTKVGQSGSFGQQMEEHRKNPTLRVVSFAEWIRLASAWKTSTRSVRGEQQDGNFPSIVRVMPTAGRSLPADRIESAVETGSRGFCPRSDGEAAHLRAGPRPANRSTGRQLSRHHRKTPVAGLPVFANGSAGFANSLPFQMRRATQPSVGRLHIREIRLQMTIMTGSTFQPPHAAERHGEPSSRCRCWTPCVRRWLHLRRKPARRIAVVYVPNGIVMNDWLPEAVGNGFRVYPHLKPLEPYRKDITVVSGLANNAAKKGKAVDMQRRRQLPFRARRRSTLPEPTCARDHLRSDCRA